MSSRKKFETDGGNGNACKDPADDIDLDSTTFVEVDVCVEGSHCMF